MTAGDLLIVPFSVAALLLATSGVAKAIRPAAAGRALVAIGVPAPFAVPATQVLAAAEASAGVAALVAPSPLASGAVAGLYAAFAVFLVYVLIRRIPLSSCGCVGTKEVPPTWTHLSLDSGAAVTAAVCTAISMQSLAGRVSEAPQAGAATVVAIAALAYVVFLLATNLPRVTRVSDP